MNKWRHLKKLSRQERSWLWRAWLLLPIVKLLLRLVGYRQTLRVLQIFCVRQCSPALSETEAQQQAKALGRLVDVAARYSVLPINCLPRALVLWWSLQRAGVVTDLRIGVRKEAASFAAHAWVEYEGTPVSGLQSECYVAFVTSFACLEKKTL